MLYDYRYKYFKGKLRTRWLGPYVIEKCHDNGSMQIRTIDAEAIPLLVNGHKLKVYKKPLSKQEFIDGDNMGSKITIRGYNDNNNKGIH